jgi:hypothetical protein
MHLKSFDVPAQHPAGKDRTKKIRPPAFLRQDLRLEWDAITAAHHNLLLVGSAPAIKAMLRAVEPHLREPLWICRPSAGVELPQPNEGTLILLEVGGLDMIQQGQMLQWLNQVQSRVQVVSTSSEPIFSLVQAGGLLSALYYRLNVVRLDLTGSENRPL